MGAPPVYEIERLCESRVRVLVEVLGFPHKTNTAATDREDAYAAAIEQRSVMRDSEYPLMRTVI